MIGHPLHVDAISGEKVSFAMVRIIEIPMKIDHPGTLFGEIKGPLGSVYAYINSCDFLMSDSKVFLLVSPLHVLKDALSDI